MKQIIEKLQKDAQQFLQNIAGKLPPALQKFIPKDASKNAEQSEAEEKSDTNERSDKTTKVNLKTMVTQLNKVNTTEGDERAAEEKAEGDPDATQVAAVDSEEEKKKKKSQLIRKVVIGGILIYVASEIIFVEEPVPPEQAPVEQQAEVKPKKKKRKNAEGSGDGTQVEAPVAQTPPTETIPAEIPTAEPPKDSTVGTSSVAPQETATESPVQERPPEAQTDPIAAATVETAPSSEVVPVETVPSSEVVPVATVPEAVAAPVETPTIPTGEVVGSANSNPEAVMDLSIPTAGNATGKVTAEDLGLKLEQAVETEKKNTDEEYVVQPDYLEAGRGLIYNCAGKHWACVNKDNYVQCHKNQQWTTKMGKTKECVTVNVYASNEDCQIIHIHNVNTHAKPGNCE